MADVSTGIEFAIATTTVEMKAMNDVQVAEVIDVLKLISNKMCV